MLHAVNAQHGFQRIGPTCNDSAVPAQLSGFGIGLRRGFHLQRLMRALLVVKLDPVANHSTGVL
jgi:hypothetical protein